MWAWLATRAASGWIAAIALAAIAALVVYVQDLRIDAARCKGRADVQAQLDKLTERVVKDIRKGTDEQIRKIDRAIDACLDQPVPDSLRDE